MTRDTNRPIRLMIVDDSASVRAALKRLFANCPTIKVMTDARDPFDAVERMRAELPDVILLDLELPRMNGLTFLKRIMEQHPLPVVVYSAHGKAGSDVAMQALQLGAVEVLAKPRLDNDAAWEDARIRLPDAVHAAAATSGHMPRRAAPLRRPSKRETADAVLPQPKSAPRRGIAPALVAIGASTGGTDALMKVLSALPARVPPLVIVQHMPEAFTEAFAKRLDSASALRVCEASDGMIVEAGLAILAPGNRHMIVRRIPKGYRVHVVDGPHVSRHRPSADVLFRSVAGAAGANGLGILMTGMGDDGASGLLEMRDMGAETLAQDERTSVVFGMPQAALKCGATDRAVPLHRIGSEIVRFGADGRDAA